MHDEPTQQPCGGPGITYFIQAIDGGPVKIGRTTTQERLALRLSSIQTGNPSPLVVRSTLDGVGHERALHHRFGHLRLRGEWFMVDDELAALSGALACKALARGEDHIVYRQFFEAGWREGLKYARGIVADLHGRLAEEVDAAWELADDDSSYYAAESFGSAHVTAHVFGEDPEISERNAA